MKTKHSLTIILLIAHLSLLTAQIPQGFNYQAIARLTTGDPIINTTLPVRITIQADSLGTAIIWQELHSSVTTNGFGLITLILGKGSRQAASTVATFSAIDWSVTPKFIKTEIDYSGWKTMGVTRLWSVPYAKVAENLGGAVSKLAVTGKTSVNDEALFEVKNKTGQTVFAVYNEGVRVYVSDGAKALKGGFAVGGFGTDKAESTKYMFVGKDSVRIYLDTNPLTKKLKGGFAVGGYDLTKGIVQDYLDVNSDSVRIYIDSNPATKKLKGGFAVGGYDMTKGTNTNYMNVNTDASGIINPSQNRILWYPLKNAFLTGKVLVEDKDSVGVNSFASGYESKAKGKYSQALGYKAIARSDYSTAIGKNAVADSIDSFAFGDSAMAKHRESYAIGRGALAEGYRSFAIGSAGVDYYGNRTGVAYAQGFYSVVIGQGSQALGYGSFAFGLADTARGGYSTAIGYQTRANGNFATSFGSYASAIGDFSTAMGCTTRAAASGSTAMGVGTVASGNCATTMGNGSRASNDCSTAMGDYTLASGYVSTAMGINTKAIGAYSTAMGVYSKAIGDGSTAMGVAIAKSSFSTVIGQYNDTTCSVGGNAFWVPTDPLFIAGNGNDDSHRKNALTLYKNGNLTIAGTLTQSSDFRLKENISSFLNGSDIIEKINPVYFYFKDKNTHPEDRQIGFIAQEVKEVLPELVQEDGQGFLSVDYSKMSVVLLQAFKEQQKQISNQQLQIESTKQENQQLKSQLQSLQEKVDKIEALITKSGGN